MWFKVENKRSSVRQKFVVRCDSDIAGTRVVEERPAQGSAAARKAAEILASTLNVTATVMVPTRTGSLCTVFMKSQMERILPVAP
jgi:hypothetical protein